jgi:SAM-dependent methyltransferase
MALLTGWLTRVRLRRISQHLGRRVLDVGCGLGQLLDYLPGSVVRVVLLDVSPERREFVHQRMSRLGIKAEFFVGNINQENAPVPPGPFDTVVMGALLEHLSPPIYALANIASVLDDQGRLVLTTPGPLGGRLHRWGSYLGLTSAEAADEHRSFYGYSELRALLEENGFKIEQYKRFLFGLNQLLVARKNRRRPITAG